MSVEANTLWIPSVIVNSSVCAAEDFYLDKRMFVSESAGRRIYSKRSDCTTTRDLVYVVVVWSR